jgi:hypothetical protein
VKTLASKYLNSEVSRFNSLVATSPSGTMTVGQVIQEIKTGTHKNIINKLRSHSGNVKEASSFKIKMPSIGASGLFEGRSLIKHVGLIQADFDKLSNPEGHKRSLFKDSHVLMACISPSGDGVKALVAINPLYHEEAKEEMIAYLNKVYPFCTLDTKPTKPNSLMIMPWDEAIMVKDSNCELSAFCGKSISGNSPTDTGTVLGTDTGLGTGIETQSIDSSVSMTYACSEENPFIKTQQLIKLREICEKRKADYLDKHPKLKRIWSLHIDRGLEVNFSERNESLVKIVSKCFYRLGREQTLQVSRAFYEIYEPFFNDTLEQHMYESAHLLDGMEKNYLRLNPDERSLYLELADELKDSYRILRSLAENELKFKKSLFALSANELSKRSGISRGKATEQLNLFVQVGIVSLIQKDESYSKGKIAKANVWKWNQPI